MRFEVYKESEMEDEVVGLRLIERLGGSVDLIVVDEEGLEYRDGSCLISISPEGVIKIWGHLDPECGFPLQENYPLLECSGYTIRPALVRETFDF